MRPSLTERALTDSATRPAERVKLILGHTVSLWPKKHFGGKDVAETGQTTPIWGQFEKIRWFMRVTGPVVMAVR